MRFPFIEVSLLIFGARGSTVPLLERCPHFIKQFPTQYIIRGGKRKGMKARRTPARKGRCKRDQTVRRSFSRHFPPIREASSFHKAHTVKSAAPVAALVASLLRQAPHTAPL